MLNKKCAYKFVAAVMVGASAFISAQTFSQSFYYVVNKTTGEKLNNCGSASNTTVTTVDVSNTTNCSQWEKVVNGPDTFHLRNRQTNEYIRPQASLSVIEAKPTSWDGTWTTWRFAESSECYGNLVNEQTGEYMSADANSVTSTTPSSSDSAKWMVLPIEGSDNIVSFRSYRSGFVDAKLYESNAIGLNLASCIEHKYDDNIVSLFSEALNDVYETHALYAGKTPAYYWWRRYEFDNGEPGHRSSIGVLPRFLREDSTGNTGGNALGWKGLGAIEISEYDGVHNQNRFADAYNAFNTDGSLVSTLPYEMGRNYMFYDNKLRTKVLRSDNSVADNGVFTTGFAVFVQRYFVEQAGHTPAVVNNPTVSSAYPGFKSDNNYTAQEIFDYNVWLFDDYMANRGGWSEISVTSADTGVAIYTKFESVFGDGFLMSFFRYLAMFDDLPSVSSFSSNADYVATINNMVNYRIRFAIRMAAGSRLYNGKTADQYLSEWGITSTFSDPGFDNITQTSYITSFSEAGNNWAQVVWNNPSSSDVYEIEYSMWHKQAFRTSNSDWYIAPITHTYVEQRSKGSAGLLWKNAHASQLCNTLLGSGETVDLEDIKLTVTIAKQRSDESFEAKLNAVGDMTLNCVNNTLN